jgi:Ser/Thr protein kinase RdoA (MazF antagonist)
MTIPVETLRSVLSDGGQIGVDEVSARLPELCSGLFTGSDIRVDRLNSRVFRVKSLSNGAGTSVVIKRLTPALAERNELVIKRYLPNIGLPDAAPNLLGTIGDAKGTCAWQVYEDLGSSLLDAQNPRADTIAAAVELIARLHTGAASAPILAECQRQLNNLGMPYFASNVRQAIAGLESLQVLEETFTSEQRAVRDRLLDRLHTLHGSIPLRAQLMRELGGPDTLLHGDLWTINTLVIPGSQGLEARLIDWDRAGVGPVAYDVSTFLYRFPSDQRLWILNEYRSALDQAGWRLPEPADLNVLFETAECARYANRIIWPTAALVSEGQESGGHDELSQVLSWFEKLEPVLPSGGGQLA